MEWLISGICIFTNLCWVALFIHKERKELEMSKLIASRTLSEYDWLKRSERGVEKQKQPPDGYDTVFSEDEDG